MGLDALLDDDGGDLVRLIGGFGIAVGLALALCVALPLGLLGTDPAALGVAARPAEAGPVAELPPTDVVRIARRYLGVPYVFGGTDPRIGLDCSALVQLVYRQAGISLPRTAQLQFDATTRLTREQLRPGDLVFFARTYADASNWITHVGIYVGDGQHLNAPAPGQVVSIQPALSGFWGTHYAGAGRVRGGPPTATPSEV